MNKKDLISRIKLAGAVKPSDAWRQSNRQFLLNQITSAEPAVQPTVVWQNYLRFFSFKIPQLVARPVGIIILVAVVALGSGVFMVSASQSSLPGDMLYPLKITSEKVQSTLLTDPQDSLALEIKFANRRMEEMELVNQKSESADRKKERVAKAANVLTQNLKNIQSNLETIKNQADSSGQAAAAAGLVDNQLNQTTTDQMTNEVKGAMDETFDKALAVMIDTFQNGRLDYQAKAEIIKTINGKIDETKEKVDALTVVLADIKIEEIQASSEKSGESDNAEVSPTGSDNSASEAEKPAVVAQPLPNKQEIAASLESAQKLLAEAKKVMIISDVVSATDKLKEVKKIIFEAEENIKILLAAMEKPAECQENCSENQENSSQDQSSAAGTEETKSGETIAEETNNAVNGAG